MADWDRIEELRLQWLGNRKDPAIREEWETTLEEEIAKLDRQINAWDHANVHELRHIWNAAGRLTIYAKRHGFPCASIFVYNEPLPSEPISEDLRGVVLAIDKHDNWLMNDEQQRIKSGPDHL
jgi:hypothetical protein